MENVCRLLLVPLLLLALNLDYCNAACGYQSCPATKANMINVHLVPHSHDDVGWLKTVDQYYYGHKNNIQHAGVQYILDNVMAELYKNSNRRFIQVETAFFHTWYEQQTDAVKQFVQNLVSEGRLEFTGGAWSMNDEAAVHYQSVIDQFSLGIKFLQSTFGDCARPRIGWQIDPFGHSREMASIFAQMGYDGQFFARMDYIEKRLRKNESTMEMIWQSSESLQDSGIFTGMLYNHYSAPPGFCFDVLCSDEPIVDGESYDNNVKTKVDAFIKYIEEVIQSFRATHIMVPMGDDFQYENAHVNYKNMDKLIKYVNERQLEGSKVNVFYSTPACYLNELHKLQQTWPSKTQDFFPYASDEHSYWTGYFTSRPTQKRFIREGNHFLQTVKQLSSLAKLTSNQHTENLDALRTVMGVMQHHDAITGTEKQAVAYDYDRMLTDAIESAESNARDALRVLTNLTSGEFESCLQLNISVCSFTSQSANNLVITLFNPLGHTVRQYVRVPVKEGLYVVTNEKGQIINSEVLPVPWQVLALPHRENTTQHDLVFSATVDKLANFHVRVLPTPRNENVRIPKRFQKLRASQHERATEFILQNSLINLVFNRGQLKSVTMNGVTENIEQHFGIYEGVRGNNWEARNRSSGAYIFRPDGDLQVLTNAIEYTVFDGAEVKEVQQNINEWISQVIRIYEGKNYVEFEWQVGPIPVGDEIGKEIVTRFTSDIASSGVFYTDSNGREMIKRERNKREYFTPSTAESVSGNYYPVTARIALQDKHKRLALLNDRAQGGSSLQDGQLELMLHRRLLNDDAFGVGEALNEAENGIGLVARGKTYLMLSEVSKRASVVERVAQHEIHLPLWKFFSRSNSVGVVMPQKLPEVNVLPSSVELLTLEPYSRNEILLRVEHILDHTEGDVVSFNIMPIFNAFNGQEIRETTLDGNLPLGEMKRFKFHLDGTSATTVDYHRATYEPLVAVANQDPSKFSVTLSPMQIRTFIIKWK